MFLRIISATHKKSSVFVSICLSLSLCINQSIYLSIYLSMEVNNGKESDNMKEIEKTK